ncbi:MAG: hypothetical protein BWY46_00222 [Firmicutes bacterium ADurb.Bin300]|nr:MAG: hypothetical protein BWY46_00222 [Firmicutes bacterium ADurb.Bin300]
MKGFTNKKVAVAVFGVLVVTVCVFFAIALNFNKNKDQNNSLTNSSNSSTKATAHFINSETAPFQYNLKATYISRAELLNEKENLGKSFEEFVAINENNENARVAARKTLEELDSIINEKLKEYPPSDEEVLEAKEQLIKEKIVFREDFYRDLSDYLKTSPDNTSYIQNYEKYKADYEEAKKIEDKYKSGELTIDQALSQLGIEYTGLPY